MVPDEVEQFGREVAARLRVTLAEDLVGVYFVGSVALGGYVAGESDIDILAVANRPVPEDERQGIADGLLQTVAHCPARGLEFTLYRADVATGTSETAGFELNVNGGPRMERAVNLEASVQPRFWYVLDRAVAHRYGVSIHGPAAAAVFGDVDRATLLRVMVESMRWHREHEKATLYSVLNASRAWRFADQNVLGSKLDGATWARQHWSNPAIIDAAVELRHGREAELDPRAVDDLLAHVEAVLRGSV